MLPESCFRFASREKCRQVENRLKVLSYPIVNDKVSEIIQTVLSQNYKFFHSIVWFKHFTLDDFEFITKKIPELSRLVNNINQDVFSLFIRMNKVGS